MAELIDKDKAKELFPDNGEGSWTYNVTAKAYIDSLPTVTEAEIRAKAIEEAMGKVAKTICIGCAYLKECKCTYKGGNCGVSKPMLENTMKALEQLKGE